MNQSPPDATIQTMSNLLSWADQLEAASRDVWQAWSDFVTGNEPRPSSSVDQATRGDDRFGWSAASLSSTCDAIVRLAKEIRSRQ